MKKRTVKNMVLLVILIISCVLCGCANVRKTIGDLTGNNMNEVVTTTIMSHKAYYMNQDGTGIVAVEYEYQGDSGDELVKECVDALKKVPEGENYKSLLEKPVQVLNCNYLADSQTVEVYLTSSYNDLTKSQEVLVRAGIVKTLTQFNNVINKVIFFVGGQAVTDSDGDILRMQGSDFVDEISGNKENITSKNVSLYFANKDGVMLTREDVMISYYSTITLENAIVDSVISGPISDGLKSVINPKTKVNKVTVREDVCYVDLDKKFLDNVDDQKFSLNVYAIVNSLTQLEGIHSVQLLVDGETYTEEKDGVSISGLLEYNSQLVLKVSSGGNEES